MNQKTTKEQANYAPGMRIVVRDAEWIVRRADPSADGGYLIECEGLSELVRGKEGRFLTSIENDTQIGAYVLRRLREILPHEPCTQMMA